MSKSRFVGVIAAVFALVAFGTATASADTASSQAATTEIAAGSVMRPAGDGCTNVPDSYLGANFRPACDKHDKCYSRSSTTDRLTCDNRLLGDLNKACTSKFGKFNPLRYGCLDMAGKYYLGVRALGRSHYHGKGNPA